MGKNGQCLGGLVSVLRDTQFFADTETFGVSVDHPASRVRFLLDRFIEPMRRNGIDIPDENINTFLGFLSRGDNLTEFDARLRHFPPSVHPLAFSPDGEVIGYSKISIGQCEQRLSDGCRIIHLSENAQQYIDPHQPSRAVISIGLRNLMSARLLLLLALHSTKHKALSAFLAPDRETEGLMFPIKFHENAIVISTTAILKMAGYDAPEVLRNEEEVDAFLAQEEVA